MRKINNKGFSLSELLVVITLLGVLLAVVVPSAVSSVASSHKKIDASAIASLEATLCNAVQRTSTYKDAQKIIAHTTNKQIIFVYIVDNNDMLVFDHCNIIDSVYGSTTSKSANDSGQALALLANDVATYVNGHMDPIELQSQYYKQQDYKIIITLSELDFIVHSTIEMGQYV